MELIEEDNGWSLALASGTVQLIKIDYRLGLLLTDGEETADLYVETPFRLVSTSSEVMCLPENPASLAPVLSLVNKTVFKARIESSGRMTIFFDDGLSIQIDPHATYEAWQIGGSAGFMLVCKPEGGVTSFKARA